MVKKIELNARSRQKAGRQAGQLRREGQIPAVMYSRGEAGQNLQFRYDDFAKAYSEAGESSLVDLTVDKEQPIKAIIKQIQRDAVKGDIIHADIYKVDMKEKLEVEVPLNFINEEEAPAVREKGGMITKALDTVYIRCLPGDLPDQLDVDLMALKDFGDAIRVKDLDLGADVEILSDPEDYIAGAEEVREQVEEEPAEEAAAEGEAAEETASEEGKEGAADQAQSAA